MGGGWLLLFDGSDRLWRDSSGFDPICGDRGFVMVDLPIWFFAFTLVCHLFRDDFYRGPLAGLDALGGLAGGQEAWLELLDPGGL